MKTIKEITNNTAIIRFIEHNKKKFKLTYDNRNGTPLGFDYRFQAEILKDDLWKTIAGKNDIKFEQISYVSDKTKLIEEGPFKILCQTGKINNTKGHKDEDRNRCRAICS